MPILKIKTPQPRLILRRFTDCTAGKTQIFSSSQDKLRAQWARTGFVVANSTNSTHSCLMKLTEDNCKHAAELGIVDKEGFQRGMETKSKESVEKGAEVYAKA